MWNGTIRIYPEAGSRGCAYTSGQMWSHWPTVGDTAEAASAGMYIGQIKDLDSCGFRAGIRGSVAPAILGSYLHNRHYAKYPVDRDGLVDKALALVPERPCPCR